MRRDEIRCHSVNVAHCLADNLDVAYNGILNLLVPLKCLQTSQGLKVTGRSLDGLRDVF